MVAEASASRVRVIGWARAAAGILSAGLAAGILFLGWCSLGWPLIHDAPLMHYVARWIADGAAPYRDFFDMNFPGIYLVHLLVLALLGPGDAGFRLFDLAWLGATGALVAVYCRRFGAWSSALGALLFMAYHLAGGAWRAGQRDFLLVVFLVAGADGVARYWETGHLRPLALAGLALGFGMTIKPHAGLFWLMLTLATAAGARRWNGGWRSAVATVVGTGLVAPAAVAAWLWQVGGLGAFVEIMTRYLLPLYSRLGGVSPLEALAGHSYGPALLVLVGSLVLLSLWRARGEFGVRRGLLLAGLGYGIAHFWIQGKGWEYHLYPLMGFACPLAASSVDPVLGDGRRGHQAVSLAGLFLLTVLLGAKGVEAREPGWIAAKQGRVASLVSDLRERIEPGERVQVLDTTEGGIHALLELGVRQPTRFLYDFHFFHDAQSPYIQGLRAEFLRDLRRRPPGFLVVFERGWPRGGYERVAAFPDLHAWIETAYTLEAERGGYRIYARRRDR